MKEELGKRLKPAVFLDRDGTICREVDYLADPGGLELLPGAAAAIAAFSAAGFEVVVITNQSGVARGLFDEQGLELIHQRLRELLAADGAHLDAIYTCPHHPNEGSPPYRRACDCRKPLPGLLLRAASERHLALESSWMVGDDLRDVEAGRAAGARPILVATGKGAAARARALEEGRPVEHFMADLAACLPLILDSGSARARD